MQKLLDAYSWAGQQLKNGSLINGVTWDADGFRLNDEPISEDEVLAIFDEVKPPMIASSRTYELKTFDEIATLLINGFTIEYKERFSFLSRDIVSVHKETGLVSWQPLSEIAGQSWKREVRVWRYVTDCDGEDA